MGTPVLSERIKSLLQGTPWGTVGFPPKANPPPTSIDGRTAALRVLRDFISELTFYKEGDVDRTTGKRGPPIPIQISTKDIHIEWPDQEVDLKFPSIVFLSGGTAGYEAIGFSSYIEEDTKDIYAPGTVVQWMSEYVESLVIEIWTNKKAERRAILAGLEAALSPTEQMYGLLFRVPDYFNELVSYSVDSREIFDEGDAALNRRRARLTVDMRLTIVSLVNYGSISVQAEVQVDVDPKNPTATDKFVLEIEEPTDPRIKLAKEAGKIPPMDPCDPFLPHEDA